MKRIKEYLLNNYGIFLLFIVWLLVVLTNYSLGTWLSGWDNLHPEFNFFLNLKRSFSSVWQEYQGLGLLGGMGHGADLFRQILLWISSLVVPVSFLRYFYHFLMLFTGATGIYFLVKDVVLPSSCLKKQLPSLASGLFYLFNLATLQMFYVPYEAYSNHFGFLPWLFWANYNFVRNRSKKTLFWLLAINLLATAQGYVLTFFLVYLISFLIVFFTYFLNNPKKIKEIFIAFIILFITNAFWLLPNSYFVLKNRDVPINSKTNLMVTSDNLAKNKKYGELKDVFLLKGFWFDNFEIDKEGEQAFIMESWINYFEKTGIKQIGYLLFCLAGLGIVLSFVLKIKNSWPFLPLFFFCLLFLANNTPGILTITESVYRLPLVSQVFRFPFTKFSILFSFVLSVYFSVFVYFLTEKIKNVYLKYFWVFFIIALPVGYLFPIFQGNLFYSKEKAIIPQEYFQTFDFFRQQDKKTRIANFPQSNYWGWTYYRWNYSGSGFLWYGIEQPILDRTFDVWSRYDENYYWEISYAVFSEDKQLFKNVLEKYQVNWILLDGNIINGATYRSLGIDQLEEILSDEDTYQLAAKYGRIKIYKVNLQTLVNDFVFVQDLPKIQSAYQWTNQDKAYSDFGSYYSPAESDPAAVFYPFRSLFTGRSSQELDFKIDENTDSFVFRKKIPGAFINNLVDLKNYQGNELPKIDENNLSKIEHFVPNLNFEQDYLEVSFPKIEGYFSADIFPSMFHDSLKVENCHPFSGGSVENSLVLDKGLWVLQLSSTDAINCSAVFSLPQLTHELAYLITVKAKNIEGKPLLFWLENQSLRRSDQELYLPKGEATSYIIQPLMQSDGLGYVLHFDNISIGKEKTINQLQQVKVNVLPYKFLSGLSMIPAEISQDRVLVYSQAYDEGWRAYEIDSEENSFKKTKILAPVFGKQLTRHVLVNNWENGWRIDQDTNIDKVVFIYLPQYLQYFGFMFLIIGGGIIILRFCFSGKRPAKENN